MVGSRMGALTGVEKQVYVGSSLERASFLQKKIFVSRKYWDFLFFEIFNGFKHEKTEKH